MDKKIIMNENDQKSTCINDCLAVGLLFIVAFLCFINVYVIGSVPVWDGDLYHKLILDYINNGYTLKKINLNILPQSQLGSSYANRILFFQLIGGIHYLTNLEVKNIYPIVNFIFALITSFFLYKYSIKCLRLSFTASLGAGVWYLMLPAVLIINQSVAHPELIMTAFIAIGYYLYLNNKLILSAIFLFLATLLKQSALLVIGFIVIDYLTREVDLKKKIKWTILFSLIGGIALISPYFFINSASLKFKYDVVINILKGLNGNLFQHILFNFEVIWILFFAGISLFRKFFQLNVVILILFGGVLSVIGSTDWFRTWFSILFFIVLPIAAKTVDTVTSDRKMHFLRGPLVAVISIMLIKPRGPVDLAYALNANMMYYVYAVIILIVCYIANQVSSNRNTNNC